MRKTGLDLFLTHHIQRLHLRWVKILNVKKRKFRRIYTYTRIRGEFLNKSEKPEFIKET